MTFSAQRALLLLAIAAAAALADCPVRGEPLERGALTAQFDSLDAGLNHGAGYGSYTNETGTLAWGESYVLEAYLAMFEATGDAKYLTSFASQADLVVAHTDREAGKKDYKGRSAPGWGATKYSNRNERVVWLAHTGMITYPLVCFCLLVKRGNLSQFSVQAATYLALAKGALNFFDPCWVYDPSTGSGYYVFDPEAPIPANASTPLVPLPFNMQLAAGRTFLALYEVTGDAEYRSKATALAKHFKAHLKMRSNGAYVWNYWYGKGYLQSLAVEDISHGAIDVDFALLAQRSGVVFNRVDLTRFLQTYKGIENQGGFADRVDGSGAGKYAEAVGGWLEFSDLSCSVWNGYARVLSAGGLTNESLQMLGVAKLLKYRNRCR